MLATTVNDHLFWITSRAAGTLALLFSSVAVGVGLSMGGKLIKGRGPDLRATHEALSMATIVAIVVHAVALLGDSFMHPSLADITIPFVSSYMTVWTTIGIVGGWMMVILGLSFYARGRIGQQRWRRLHRFTALAWILGLAHSLGEGTDAGKLWFLVATGIVALPAAVAARRPHVAPAPRAPGGRTRGGRAMSDGIVIAGGGLAGQRCAETLRRAGYEGRIRMLCGEPRAPYDRPPLSKAVLASPEAEDGLGLRPASWYADRGVELLLGARAAALDCARHVVTLDDGHAARLRAAAHRHRQPPAPPGAARRIRQRPHAAHARGRPRAARRAGRGRPPGRRRRRLHRPGGRGRGGHGRRADHDRRGRRRAARRACSAPWSGPGSPTCTAARASTSSSARASPRRPAPTASSG